MLEKGLIAATQNFFWQPGMLDMSICAMHPFHSQKYIFTIENVYLSLFERGAQNMTN